MQATDQATTLQTALPRAIREASGKLVKGSLKEDGFKPLVNIKRRIFDEMSIHGSNGQATAKEISEHLETFGYKKTTVSSMVSQMQREGLLERVSEIQPYVYRLKPGVEVSDDSPVRTLNRLSKKQKEELAKEEEKNQRKLKRLARTAAKTPKENYPPLPGSNNLPTSAKVLETMPKEELKKLSEAIDVGLYSFEKGPANETPAQRDERIINKVLDSISYRQGVLLLKAMEELRNA